MLIDDRFFYFIFWKLYMLALQNDLASDSVTDYPSISIIYSDRLRQNSRMQVSFNRQHYEITLFLLPSSQLRIVSLMAP